MNRELPTQPLASCITPTANRRHFLPQAIQYFLAQDYPNKELIIVDDGEQAVEDLVPQDERIRYIRVSCKAVLGHKRNRAVGEAQGEIIVHWDDDDWSAPWRLRYQVAELVATRADICGLDRIFFYAPSDRRAWQYVYPDRQRPWVYGASLAYRKVFWTAHPFANIGVGEDTRFVWAHTQAKIHVLNDPRCLVAIIHSENCSPKRTSDPRYQPRPVEEIEKLLGHDLSFYIAPQPRSDKSRASSPEIKPKQRALVSAALGVGDILRITPLIRVVHRLGYGVDVLLATDYADAVSLLEGAPEIRTVFHVPSPRRGKTSTQDARLTTRVQPDGLSDQTYDIATFTTWSVALRDRVQARSVHLFEQARWLAEGDRKCVERIARALGWQGELPPPFAMPSGRKFDLPPGTIAIHPGCKEEWPWKKWHGFDDLARLFSNVVIVGTEEDLRTDNTYFERAFSWPQHAQNFVGKLSLSDTAALLRECAALVSNDSGLMHLGAALGVPTFGIFGITSPDREMICAPNMFPITKGLPCEPACRQRPWGRRDCEYHLRCLQTLTPEEVMQKVLEKTPGIAVRVAERSSHPPSLEVRKHHDPIRVVVEITGGIGDLVVAGQLLLHLQSSVPECATEVFYHTPGIAQFVFHQARFVRAVHAVSGFAEAFRRCDVALRIHSMVKCEIQNIAKLRRVDGVFANRLQQAIHRFETFSGFFAQEPQFDGLWGRLCVRNGFDRRTSLGWLTGLSIGLDSPLFLAPDPDEYVFFERFFPDPSTAYVTIHDGFDNNVRLAPGAATKCWPFDHWTALIRKLKETKPELKIVQIGSRNSRSIPGVDVDLLQRTSLSQAAWILKHAQAHIDGDSGLVHLARALHTPSVVLFGPTDDQFFGYSQNINLTASGCGNCWWSTPSWLSRCPRGLSQPECMTAIVPDRVCAAACEIIEKRQFDKGRTVASAVYGHLELAKLDDVLTGIFEAADLPRVPISEHAWGPEAGVYLHASKQWEYLFAWRQLTERFAGGVAGVRIADIGGGRGAWAAFLANRGADVEAFDVDYLWDHRGDTEIESRFFRWAQKHGYQPRFGSLFNLPIDTATLDVVTSISVVEHLRHKRYALMEALRVLKPGGLLIITFDLSLHPEQHQDSLRQEIFSPQSLDRTLAELGIWPAGMSAALVAESATRIQQDRVLGIPVGMTVGGIAIAKI